MLLAAACLVLLLLPGRALLAPDAIQPHLTTSPDGTFFCTYLAGGDVFLSRSSDGGKTWSTPVVAIAANHRAAGGMQRGPRAGAAQNGLVYVSAPLALAEDGAADGPPDLWLATSRDGGESFGKPVRVNDAPGKAPEALHWLAVAADGTAHLAWLDLRGRRNGQDLYYARVAGGHVGPNTRLAETLCECCAPGLCVDHGGNPLAVFREGGQNANRKILLIASRDGGTTWGQPQRVNTVETRVSICPMDAPAIAAIDAKVFSLAWMDMRDGPNRRAIHWVASKNGELGTEQPLASRAAASSTQGHPSLCYDSAGELHAAWEEASDGNKVRVCYRRGASGAVVPVSAEDEGKAEFPSLACGKAVGMAYQTDAGVVFCLVAD
jgi:hypothetical protein